jgi:uncharacterized protein (TIGR02246 family)
MIILVVLFGSSAIRAAGSDDSSDAQLHALAHRFALAVNAMDAKALGSLFAPDGEFTNPVGMSEKGRTAIEKFHAKLFEEGNRPSFAHAHLKLLNTSIRLIRPDVAVMDIRWEQSGAIAPDGSPWGVRNGILSWVVTHESDGWFIATWHNMELHN